MLLLSIALVIYLIMVKVSHKVMSRPCHGTKKTQRKEMQTLCLALETCISWAGVVTQDLNQAMSWLKKAVDNRNQKAKDSLKELPAY